LVPILKSAAPSPLGELSATLLQVSFVNRGAYGFVILALDKQTGEQVALKFIQRGAEHITKYVDREVSRLAAAA
jgi:serine/threonine-protein kinase SRK2